MYLCLILIHRNIKIFLAKILKTDFFPQSNDIILSALISTRALL